MPFLLITCRMAGNDFTGLAELAAEAAALEREGEALEEEWLETAEEAKP